MACYPPYFATIFGYDTSTGGGTFTDLVADTLFLNSGDATANGFSTDTSLGTSNTLVPTQNAVKTYVDNAISGAGTYQVLVGVGCLYSTLTLAIAYVNATLVLSATQHCVLYVYPGQYVESITLPAYCHIVGAGDRTNVVKIINSGNTDTITLPSIASVNLIKNVEVSNTSTTDSACIKNTAATTELDIVDTKFSRYNGTNAYALSAKSTNIYLRSCKFYHLALATTSKSISINDFGGTYEISSCTSSHYLSASDSCEGYFVYANTPGTTSYVTIANSSTTLLGKNGASGDQNLYGIYLADTSTTCVVSSTTLVTIYGKRGYGLYNANPAADLYQCTVSITSAGTLNYGVYNSGTAASVRNCTISTSGTDAQNVVSIAGTTYANYIDGSGFYRVRTFTTAADAELLRLGHTDTDAGSLYGYTSFTQSSDGSLTLTPTGTATIGLVIASDMRVTGGDVYLGAASTKVGKGSADGLVIVNDGTWSAGDVAGIELGDSNSYIKRTQTTGAVDYVSTGNINLTAGGGASIINLSGGNPTVSTSNYIDYGTRSTAYAIVSPSAASETWMGQSYLNTYNSLGFNADTGMFVNTIRDAYVNVDCNNDGTDGFFVVCHNTTSHPVEGSLTGQLLLIRETSPEMELFCNSDTTKYASFSVAATGTLTIAPTSGTTAITGTLDASTALKGDTITSHGTIASTTLTVGSGTQMEAEIDGVLIDINAGANGLTVDSGSTIAIASTTTTDIQATTNLTIDSTSGSIGIGTDAVTGAINIGTSATARTITVGNAASTAVNANALALTLTSAGGRLNLQDGLAYLDADTTTLRNDTGLTTYATINSSAFTLSASYPLVSEIVRVKDSTTSRYVSLQAPALAASYNWIFPTTDGVSGDILTTDGSGNLSWAQQYFSVQNTIVVRKDPGTGEYSTINAAIAAVPGSPSDTNRWLIWVFPGVYSETEITIPSYVYVCGVDYGSVVIEPDVDNHTVVNISSNGGLSICQIRNCPNSKAISMVNGGNFIVVHRVSIFNCGYGIYATATTTNSQIYMEYVDVTDAVNYGAYIKSTGGFTMYASLSNWSIWGDTIAVQYGIYADGTAADVEVVAGELSGYDGTGYGCYMTNGTVITFKGYAIYNYNYGIYSADSGSNAVLRITGSNIRNNTTYNMYIASPTTSGSANISLDRTKLYINASSTFYINQVNLNIVKVAQKGGDFTSIVSALAWITGETSTNQYVIEIGPGVFTESTITLRPYISIKGETTSSSIIQSSATNINLIVGDGACTVQDCTLSGPTSSGFACIAYSGSTVASTMFKVINVNFTNCYYGVNVTSTTAEAVILLNTVGILGPTTSVNTFVKAVDNGTNDIELSVQYLSLYAEDMTATSKLFDLSGEESHYYLNNISCIFEQPTSPSTVVYAYNGCELILRNSVFKCFTKGVDIPNSANAVEVRITAVTFENNLSDISIAQSTATGSILAVADRTKVTCSSNNISINIADVNGGLVLLGDIYQTNSSFSNITNISDALQYGSTLGVTTGATLSAALLVVTAQAGSGYLNKGTSPSDYLVYVTWSLQTISVSANDAQYIYIDNAGVIQKSASKPNIFTTIPLGFVISNATQVIVIQEIQQNAYYQDTCVNRTLEDGLGNMVGSGLLVSSNATAMKINIADGVYYYSGHKYSPSSTSAATFHPFFKSATPGIWTRGTATDTIPLKYDDASGTLQDLPMLPPNFAKHALYVVGDSTNQDYLFVYGQELFADSGTAIAGSMPAAPSFFVGNACLICGIVVGYGDISLSADRYVDMRPIFVTRTGTISSTLDHNSLLNLTVGDPHTQYLPVDGSRSMAGTLNMNSNIITNSGTINGITITAHGSRHDPDGADAITVGTPVAVGTANAEGVLSSVARSDHVHAHGAQTTSTDHAAATAGANGFMSSTDKTKLDAATNLDTVSTLMFRDASGNVQVKGITVTTNLSYLNGGINVNSSKFTVSTAGAVDADAALTVDTINQHTGGAGVTISGILLKADTESQITGDAAKDLLITGNGSATLTLGTDAFTTTADTQTFKSTDTLTTFFTLTSTTATVASGVQLDVTNTTNATNSSSGAIITAGGIGVTQDIYTGGKITSTGNVATAATLKGDTLTSNSTLASTTLTIGAGTQMEVQIDSVLIDINAGANGLTVDSGSTIAILSTTTTDIQATTNLTLDSTSGSIGIGTDAVTGAINIGTSATARTITVGNAASTAVNANALSIALTSGGIIDLQATGNLTVDSSGGRINIGTDADTGQINIGTSATARTITIGSSSSTAVNINKTTTIDGNLVIADSGTVGIASQNGLMTLALNSLAVAGSETLTKAGTAAGNLDILTFTNSVNDASMTATETSLLFNQYYYDAVLPAAITEARITAGTTGNWTSTASTQNSYMLLKTMAAGTMKNRMKLDNTGKVTLYNSTTQTSTGSLSIDATDTGILTITDDTYTGTEAGITFGALTTGTSNIRVTGGKIFTGVDGTESVLDASTNGTLYYHQVGATNGKIQIGSTSNYLNYAGSGNLEIASVAELDLRPASDKVTVYSSNTSAGQDVLVLSHTDTTGPTTGTLTFNVNKSTGSTLTPSGGTLTVTGSEVVSTNLTVNGTTDSSSISTGTIITAGGVGIAKNCYATAFYEATGHYQTFGDGLGGCITQPGAYGPYLGVVKDNNGGVYAAGYALTFNGTSYYATIASNATWTHNGTSWALSMWIIPSYVPDQAVKQVLIGKPIQTANSYQLYLQDKKLHFYVGVSGLTMTPDTVIVTGQRYNIFINVDATVAASPVVNIYINGKLSTQRRFGTAFTASNAITYIGAAYNGATFSSYYTGIMDELRIWGALQTEATITSIYNSGLGTETNAIGTTTSGVWHFNTGTGTTDANSGTGTATPVTLIDAAMWTTPNMVATTAPSVGVIGYFMDYSFTNYLYKSFQLPRSWSEGTTIYVNVQWMPATTATGNVKFNLEYTWTNNAGTAASTTVATNTVNIAGAAQYVLQTTDVPSAGISGSGKTMNSNILCRLERDSTVASSLAGDIILVDFSMRCIVNKFGYT